MLTMGGSGAHRTRNIQLGTNDGNTTIIDPFFADVIYLATMSDSGDIIVDYSPLANTITIEGVGAEIITQDATQQLFGNNTLRFSKLLADSEKRIFTLNTTTAISNTDDIVIEGWYRIELSALFTESPILLWFQQVDGGGAPLANLMRVAESAPPTDVVNARFNATTGINQASTYNNWHYFAFQHVNADNLSYFSLDGTIIYNIAGSLADSPGFQVLLLAVGIGASANFYTGNLAQLRITRANRYGSTAAPIPTSPWPLS